MLPVGLQLALEHGVGVGVGVDVTVSIEIGLAFVPMGPVSASVINVADVKTSARASAIRSVAARVELFCGFFIDGIYGFIPFKGKKPGAFQE